MKNKNCPKCGNPVDSHSMICMNCGADLKPSSYTDSVEDIKENHPKQEAKAASEAVVFHSLGTALITIGIFCDVICMMLVGSGTFEEYKIFAVGGTICFLIGLFLRFGV